MSRHTWRQQRRIRSLDREGIDLCSDPDFAPYSLCDVGPMSTLSDPPFTFCRLPHAEEGDVRSARL